MGSRNLSSRESAILALASDGHTDKQIAAELHLSIGTIRTYWSRIRNKLDAATRAQAVGLHVRGATNGRFLHSDTLCPVRDACQKLGLPSWTVDETGMSMVPINPEGDNFLKVLPPGCWIDYVDKDRLAEVRRTVELASSCKSGKARVARISFARPYVKGHVLCLPLAEKGLGCCVVFVPD